jgi:hypothetical protein
VIQEDMAVSRDLDNLLAEDWRRIRAIEEADADLSAAEEDLLETAIRRLERDKPLSSELRASINALYDNLAELVKND